MASFSVACIDCGEDATSLHSFDTTADRDAWILQHGADAPDHNRQLTINGPVADPTP